MLSFISLFDHKKLKYLPVSDSTYITQTLNRRNNRSIYTIYLNALNIFFVLILFFAKLFCISLCHNIRIVSKLGENEFKKNSNKFPKSERQKLKAAGFTLKIQSKSARFFFFCRKEKKKRTF